MKIRNPFKDKWLRWKDDASIKERLIWSSICSFGGLALGILFKKLGFYDFIISLFRFTE